MELDPECCGVPSHEETIAQLKEHLSDVLPLLTPREQKILELRFGIDNDRSCTPEEVAKELNITRERIRQIEAKALRKLRRLTTDSPVKDERLPKLEVLHGEGGEHAAPAGRTMHYRPRSSKLKDFLE